MNTFLPFQVLNIFKTYGTDVEKLRTAAGKTVFTSSRNRPETEQQAARLSEKNDTKFE